LVDLNINNGSGLKYYADGPNPTNELPVYFLVPNGTNIVVETWPKMKDESGNIVSVPVDSFEWYIDEAKHSANAGEDLGDASDPTSYSVFVAGAGLDVGFHTISVLVTKGTTVSSRRVQIIVQEPEL
jgi:hypothetical protein